MSDQSDLLQNSNSEETNPSLNVTGLLPSQVISEMIRSHEILSVERIDSLQLQPASLDLRLDATAYRVRSSFLPGQGKTVRESLKDVTMGEVDLREGAILEKGCVYMVPLKETLALPSRITAVANPKSSIGRLDIFTRLITDEATEFDRVHSSSFYSIVDAAWHQLLHRFLVSPYSRVPICSATSCHREYRLLQTASLS